MMCFQLAVRHRWLNKPLMTAMHLSYCFMMASLVAQTVKRLPTMQETQVRFLGREDPRRRKWQSTPALLPGKSHQWRSLTGHSPWGHEESDTTERLHFLFFLFMMLHVDVVKGLNMEWDTYNERTWLESGKLNLEETENPKTYLKYVQGPKKYTCYISCTLRNILHVHLFGISRASFNTACDLL